MKLEHGCGVFACQEGRGASGLWVSKFGDVRTQCLSAVEPNEIADLVEREKPEHQPAAEIGRPKPWTFFAAHGDGAQGPARSHARSADCRKYGEASCDAGQTVIVAAMGNGIEV
jgi:hypothetical protein